MIPPAVVKGTYLGKNKAGDFRFKLHDGRVVAIPGKEIWGSSSNDAGWAFEKDANYELDVDGWWWAQLGKR
jgi:hypothetical protein